MIRKAGTDAALPRRVLAADIGNYTRLRTPRQGGVRAHEGPYDSMYFPLVSWNRGGEKPALKLLVQRRAQKFAISEPMWRFGGCLSSGYTPGSH